jgi:MFS family permease
VEEVWTPAVVLPGLMVCFGFMTILTVAPTNFGGMMALRWFLGMSESAFFPLVIYYLTTFSRRGELARRLAIFYAASKIANAFSGLLAVGIFRITNTPLYPWRYLFLIQGSLTFLFAIFAFFYLPPSAASARFLNDAEKKLAYHRIQVDSSSIVNEKFNPRDSVCAKSVITLCLCGPKPKYLTASRAFLGSLRRRVLLPVGARRAN